MLTKALIVDEAAGVRLLLSRILGSAHCATVEASDGGAAIEALEQNDIDLAIFDVDAPLIPGIDLLQAVRTSERYAMLPVVMIMGAAERSTVAELVTLGASDCLTKPLDEDTVRSRLQRIMTSAAHLSRRAAPSGAPRAAGTALVVDRNAEFRHFVANVLAPSYSIVQAENGLHALRTCNLRPPSVLILGNDTGLLAPRLLARRLRHSPALADMRIVLVVAKDAARDVVDPTAFDAILTRTFVPAEFAGQFHRVFSTFKSGDRDAIADIRRNVVAATEQALGMMARTDIALIEEGRATMRAPEAEASTVMTLHMQRVAVRFTLMCDQVTARRLAARMMGVQESEVAADDAHAGLGEMVNVIVGRVKTAARNEGESVSFRIPEARPVASAAPRQAADCTLRFASGDRDVALAVVLTIEDGHAALHPVA